MNHNEYSYQVSDVLKKLGDRVKTKRLQLNITQLECADKAGVSRRTVQAIEGGESISLGKFLAQLEVLHMLPEFDREISDVLMSPLELAKRKGKQRKRSSKTRQVNDNNEIEQW
ncbi:MAG: helix-turn-helix domain-containing protein [Fibrobacterales bacterium]